MVTIKHLRNQLLQELNGFRKVVVLGIGNELRCDDALGVITIRRLKRAFGDTGSVSIIDCGDCPENFTGSVSRLSPSHIVLIDAVHWGGKAGEVRLIDADAVMEEIPSTHGMPLSMLVKYLGASTGAKILILGIQPRKLSLDTGGSSLSREVDKAIGVITKLLYDTLAINDGVAAGQVNSGGYGD